MIKTLCRNHLITNLIKKRPMSTKQSLEIDITSDNICPWCYVGKRRLDKALSQIDTSNLNIRINWHPFELDPGLPSDGSLVKMDRYKQKFGETRVKQMLPQMIETGKQEGIQFSFGGRVGSTFDSHRLIFFVQQQPNGDEKQNELIQILFRNYFEEEKDLSDREVLISAGEQIGFNRKEIQEFLQSDQYKKEVRQEIQQAQQHGISGVPFFRLNKQIELSGAQDPQTFIQAFKKLGLKI